METSDTRNAHARWLGSVLTDVHFWVPVAVLLVGLLLLSSMH